MTDDKIESLLRKAPHLSPPPGLQDRLEAGIALPPPQRSRRARARPLWRRWFPALAFGSLFLMSFLLLAVQTNQIVRLRRENTALKASTVQLRALRQEQAELRESQLRARQLESLRQDQLELEQLRAELARLRAKSAELVGLRAEHQRLQAALTNARSQTAATAATGPQPVAEGREEELSFRCKSNLKQLGLAARFWAQSHERNLPADFLVLSNVLNTPRILVCPADTVRIEQMPRTWAEFKPQNATYEILSPGVNEREQNAVFARCPIHGHVILVSGKAEESVPPGQIIDVNGLKVLHR